MISYSSLVKKKSISCRFYTEDANSGNAHRAAGMTIELRDTGTYGFELPPSQVYSYIQQVVWAWKFARHDIIIVFLIMNTLPQIIPNGEEIVPAVLAFAEELNKSPLKKP